MTLRTIARRAGAASVAIALVAVATPVTANESPPATVVVDGADLVSIALDQRDQLSIQIRDADQRAGGQPGHDPAAVRLPDGGGTAGTVPEHAAFRFLGAPGAPVWALAGPERDFPSWDTTGVRPDLIAGDTVDLSLVGVDGPGDFHAYGLTPVGAPELLVGTSPDAPGNASLPAGVRQGGAIWVFDTPGSYQVTLAASVALATGGVASDQTTYQVEVPVFANGPVPLAANPPPERAQAGVQELAQQNDAQTNQADDTGQGQVVIDDGHVDIGPRFVGGETWTVQVKDDTVSPHVWRNLHDVVLHVVDEASIEVPAGGDFAFLGDPGDTVWLLPQAQQAGILWPGWNTEHESVVGAISGNTSWTLHGVDGPGEFVLFLTGSFGQSEILFNTRDDLPQSMSIPPRTHAHGNWAFTEPGVYHLTIEMSATTADGEQVTDTRILGMAVGDVDPSTAFPPAANGNGNGNGNGDGNGAGGRMPKTGFSGLVPMILIGALLLAAGTVVVLLTRRRRAAGASK